MYGKALGEAWKQNFFKKTTEKSPIAVVSYADLGRQYLGETGYSDLIDKVLINENAGLSRTQLGDLMERDDLTESQTESIKQRVINDYPSLGTDYLDKLLENVPDEEQPVLIRELIERDPHSLLGRPNLLDRMTDFNEQQKNDFAREIIMDSGDFKYLISYTEKGERGDFIRGLITPDEIRGLIERDAAIDSSSAFLKLDEISKVLGGDKELEKFIRTFALRNTYSALSHFKDYAYLLPQEEREPMLHKLIKQDEVSAVDSMDKWLGYLSPQGQEEVIERFSRLYPGEMIIKLKKIKGRYKATQGDDYVETLVMGNPFIAMARIDHVEKYLPGFDRKQIINKAQSDQERFSCAPQSLKDTYKRLDRAKTSEQEELAFLEGHRLYSLINLVKEEGLTRNLQTLLETENPNLKGEKEFLENINAYIIVQRFHGREVDANNFPRSAQELHDLLSREIGEIFGTKDMSAEEQQKAIDSFGGAAPIMLYASKHQQDPEISGLLKTIFTESGKGRYKDWRFEKDRPLTELQDEGKLPVNLTQEQYDGWIEDEKTDISAALEISSKDIAAAIKTAIVTNAPHIDSEALQQANGEATMGELKQNLQEIGQKISQLGKSLKGSTPDQEKNIRAEMAELSELRKRLEDERDLLRLTMLSAEEISQGYLLEGEQNRRGQKINKLVRSLREHFSDSQSVFDQIQKSLAELETGDQSAQKLVAEDSSDLQVNFHIGAEPETSCQHYATGSMNEALLGYVAEANTKATIIKNEKGKIIGRRVTRILGLRDGTPVMFLEEKYASTASGIVDKVMLTHLVNKAEKMGMRLFIKSSEALPDGYSLVSRPDTLYSKGGRAPQVYVDAEGGKKSHGKYSIRGVKEIIKQ